MSCQITSVWPISISSRLLLFSERFLPNYTLTLFWISRWYRGYQENEFWYQTDRGLRPNSASVPWSLHGFALPLYWTLGKFSLIPFLKQSYKVSTVVIPILHTRNLRLREVKWHTRGVTKVGWDSCSFSKVFPLLSVSQSCLFRSSVKTEYSTEFSLVLYNVSTNGCLLQYTDIPTEKYALNQIVLYHVAVFYFSPSLLITWMYNITVVFNVRILDGLWAFGESSDLYMK